MFNQEQLASLFRTLLQVAGGYLIAKGYIGAEEWAAISGGLLVIGITAWGVYVRRNTALIQSAANVPEVAKIIAPASSVSTDKSYPKVTTQ